MSTILSFSQALVDRCKNGDRRAEPELYQRYAQGMYKVAVQMLRDPMEAEDVVQVAFTKAFRRLHTYKGDASFGAWLKRIVVNTAINHMKKRKLEYFSLEENHHNHSEDTPQDEALRIDMTQIQWAIQQLPVGYQKVFTLYQLEGYDHGEISNILDISEATSKSQFCRAKKKLREMLTA